MKISRFCAVLALAGSLLGCDHDRFEIEIRPDGASVERKLTAWHVNQGEGESQIEVALPEEELTRLAGLYEERTTPDGATKHTFVGQFTGKMPADVGGAGSYTPFTSPMGTASAYVERFRGNDDLDAELAKRRKAANQLTDLLIGWFEAELGDEPNFDRLRRFLDEDLRRDLRNLGVYLWTADGVQRREPDAGREFLVRIGQYLVERGYLTVADLPRLARAIPADDPAPLVEHIQRLLADKLGVPADQPIPDSLAFLADEKRREKSFNAYVRTTKAFARRMAQWQEQRKTNPNVAKPEPGVLLKELIDDALIKFDLFTTPDQLQLKLFCESEPYETNGTWEENSGVVNWSTGLDAHPALPAFCYALWSVPNRSFQQKHFGKVVLSDEGLAKYVLWYQGLTEEETAQWDRFLDGCQPGKDLAASIKAFYFKYEAKPGENAALHALDPTPRDLLLEGLEE